LKPVIVRAKLVEPVFVYFEVQEKSKTLFYKGSFPEFEMIVTPIDTFIEKTGQSMIKVEKEYKLCTNHIELQYINKEKK
jgi:peptidyl-tRNA hydrolase